MIQVATIQTLRNRWEHIPDNRRPDLIFVDEAHIHHTAHGMIMSWAKDNKVPVIGLSATPWRKGLATLFDDLVIGSTPAQLTELGFLKDSVCYSVFNPDLKGVKTKANGDWVDDELATVMGESKLMGDIVQTWITQGYGRKTIAFCVNVMHSRALCEKFNKAGIKAVEVNGFQRDEERSAAFKAYEEGDAQVMCSVNVISRGYDFPPTSCLLLARPTKSRMMHYQMLGRGMRVGGFDECVVLDFAGNLIRNGMPLDDLPTELDDGKNGNAADRKSPDKKEKEPKPCVKCQALIAGRNCPHCFTEQPLPKQDVESAAGELVQISGAKREKKWTPLEKAQIYAQFLAYARMHGKRDGWAYYATKDYCGSTPMDKSQVAISISPEILSWIKSRNIAFAKRKQA
jgi:superfamily II DNA or RNA helicase